MGSITFTDGVAIAMLVFYAVSLPLTIFISARHGLAKSSGWILLTTFCIIRIIGCSAQLATITQGDTGTAATIAEVTIAIGFSGLLLASLGLLSRLYNSILKGLWGALLSFYIIKLVQTPCAVSLVLSIVGATSAASPTDIYQETTLRIGCIILVVVVVALCLLYFLALVVYHKKGRGERQLVIALGLSLPLLIVRAVWPLLECFGGEAVQEALGSNTKGEFLRLFLAHIEEVATTLIYIVAGLSMRSVPKEDGQGGANAKERVVHRAQRGDFNGGKAGLLSMGIEIIRSAVALLRRQRREGRAGDAA